MHNFTKDVFRRAYVDFGVTKICIILRHSIMKLFPKLN